MKPRYRRSGLGRGIEALIPTSAHPVDAEGFDLDDVDDDSAIDESAGVPYEPKRAVTLAADEEDV